MQKWIFISRNRDVRNEIKGGFDNDEPLSGLFGTIIRVSKLQIQYPIYNPLILDKNGVTKLRTLSKQIHSKLFEKEDMTEEFKCFNELLTCSNHSSISYAVFQEAIDNFLYEFKTFPFQIKRPMNHLFEAARIDGVYSLTYSVSFRN